MSWFGSSSMGSTWAGWLPVSCNQGTLHFLVVCKSQREWTRASPPCFHFRGLGQRPVTRPLRPVENMGQPKQCGISASELLQRDCQPSCWVTIGEEDEDLLLDGPATLRTG